jgi:transcriptional regulator with XRE-family HTH domain
MTPKRSIKELCVLGVNVKRLRDARDWTLVELAARSGLAASYISGIERAKMENPSLYELDSIAVALGASLRELFIDTEDPPDKADILALWEGLDERGREMTRELMRAWRLKQLVDGTLQ